MQTTTQQAVPLFKVFTPDTVLSALKPVIESGRLATGNQVATFERALADWLGVPSVLALNDASGALMMAMYLAGVRPGDEVITSPMACAATLMPIANLFAKPVWADVDPDTGMPDVARLAAKITDSTRAILIYHWSGNVAAMGAIRQLADTHGIALIEDASEAFGGKYAHRRLGGIADYTVYSFYATKHIQCGEGAALIASSADNLTAARHLRRFGINYQELRRENGDLNPDFDIPVAGFNLTMNEVAACFGVESIRHADQIVGQYQANGNYYREALMHIAGIKLLRHNEDTQSAYWTFSFLAERRDELIRKLVSQQIGTQRLHLRNDHYSCFGIDRVDLPGVDQFDQSNISIPCGWWVSAQDRERIVNCIREGW